jgi:hypothetical protein
MQTLIKLLKISQSCILLALASACSIVLPFESGVSKLFCKTKFSLLPEAACFMAMSDIQIWNTIFPVVINLPIVFLGALHAKQGLSNLVNLGNKVVKQRVVKKRVSL